MTTEEGIREEETKKEGIHPHQESQDSFCTAATGKKHDTDEIFAKKRSHNVRFLFLTGIQSPFS